MNIHCEGCEKKVKRLLKEIDGVYSTKTDATQGTVAVVGNVDPSVLINKLAKKNKPAVLLAQFDDHGSLAGGSGFKPNFEAQKHHSDSSKDGDEEKGKEVVTKSVTVMKKNRSKENRRQKARWFNLGFLKDFFSPPSRHVRDDTNGRGGGGEQEIQIIDEEEEEAAAAKSARDRVIVKKKVAAARSSGELTVEEGIKKKIHDERKKKKHVKADQFVGFGTSKGDVVIKHPASIQTAPSTLQEALVRTHAAKMEKQKTPKLLGEEEQQQHPITSKTPPLPLHPHASAATTTIPMPSTQSYFSDDNTTSCHLM